MSTVLGVLVFVVWLWALVDVLRNDFTNNNKLIWLLTVVLIPVVGFTLYILIGRFQKIETEEEIEEETAPAETT